MTKKAPDSSVDPGVDANRHSHEVYRYRVKPSQAYTTPLQIRGRQYQPGEVVLLRGHVAFREAPYRLMLHDPKPVKQTSNPATWEAQHATSFFVHMNKS